MLKRLAYFVLVLLSVVASFPREARLPVAFAVPSAVQMNQIVGDDDIVPDSLLRARLPWISGCQRISDRRWNMMTR